MRFICNPIQRWCEAAYYKPHKVWNKTVFPNNHSPIPDVLPKPLLDHVPIKAIFPHFHFSFCRLTLTLLPLTQGSPLPPLLLTCSNALLSLHLLSPSGALAVPQNPQILSLPLSPKNTPLNSREQQQEIMKVPPSLPWISWKRKTKITCFFTEHPYTYNKQHLDIWGPASYWVSGVSKSIWLHSIKMLSVYKHHWAHSLSSTYGNNDTGSWHYNIWDTEL